jgi:hypothetical protein
MMMPHQAKIRTHPGGARPARRREARRSKNWMIVLSLGAAAAVAALAGFSSGLFSRSSSGAVTAAVPESLPTGTIAESDIPVCRRLTFDDKGQVVRDVVPCDGSVRDAHGQPVPLGTIERLDAISKAFAGH